MRPVDLAREHGLSAQAIRNYDDAGIFPPTGRTEAGYRYYTPLHAQALRTFLTLRRGHGHRRATDIMRAVNRHDTESAYRLIDATHVEVLAERDTRTEVATVLGGLTATAPASVPGRPLTADGQVTALAGTDPAALRLDGDNLRHGLNGDLGFSPEDRAENSTT